jgi:hypothetical protein
MRLERGEEAVFQVVEWLWLLIICLLEVAKSDIGEVDKAIFQVEENL